MLNNSTLTATLHDAPAEFLLLDRITTADGHQLVGYRYFEQAPFWHLVEAAAQLAAYHQRWLHVFAKQAFLLSVHGLALHQNILCGEAQFTARLRGQTAHAASYQLEIQWENKPCPVLSFTVHIGICEYAQDMKKEALEPYYRHRWQQLQTSPECR